MDAWMIDRGMNLRDYVLSAVLPMARYLAAYACTMIAGELA